MDNNSRAESGGTSRSDRLRIRVIGAGLAGCEAAWAAARAGVAVELCEMKPARYTPAHSNPDFAELVCSNSFKAQRIESAAGLLKAEMRMMESLCLHVADGCAVPAGGALAVDRRMFASGVTAAINSDPRITVVPGEVTELPGDGVPTVIAAGPLASDKLAVSIARVCGGLLSFYDAAAPVVAADSIDYEHAFTASRYEDGTDGDYINCPLDKEEYEAFHAALVTAQRAALAEFDRQPAVYEGCMPIEVLAARGLDAIRFGPMKPVGLRDPKTGRRPWAVLQLRREDAGGAMRGLVGFQTNLKFGEQRRVFGMIPALRTAEYYRYGVMHRNSFLDSPRLLEPTYRMRYRSDLFFAGQITGVEGYMESAASGMLAGRNAARLALGQPLLTLPAATMTGALAAYISGGAAKRFQPMGANFGLLPPLAEPIRDKKLRYEALARRSLRKLADKMG